MVDAKLSGWHIDSGRRRLFALARILLGSAVREFGRQRLQAGKKKMRRTTAPSDEGTRAGILRGLVDAAGKAAFALCRRMKKVAGRKCAKSGEA
jgi:hypothetical protein